MENWLFDHVLGWLKSTRPDIIDGLSGNEWNRVSVFDPDYTEVYVSDEAVFVDSNPGHWFQAIREQIFGSSDSSDPPLMMGFAQQTERMSPGLSKSVTSGFKSELLPVYIVLANEFAVFDKWFASVPASTQPNQFYKSIKGIAQDLIDGWGIKECQPMKL